MISSRVPRLRRKLGRLRVEVQIWTRRCTPRRAVKLRKPCCSEDRSRTARFWVPARRFGLRQSTKVRQFSEMGHNITLVTDFKVDLARLLGCCLARGGTVIFRGEEDEEYRVPAARVHSSGCASVATRRICEARASRFRTSQLGSCDRAAVAEVLRVGVRARNHEEDEGALDLLDFADVRALGCIRVLNVAGLRRGCRWST